MLFEQHSVGEYGTVSISTVEFACFKTVGEDVVYAVDACTLMKWALMKSSVVCLSCASERTEQSGSTGVRYGYPRVCLSIHKAAVSVESRAGLYARMDQRAGDKVSKNELDAA
jgi:hypothetical protein